MNIFLTKNTGDFELLDSGSGYRLEKWGDYILARPDPQAIWQKSLPENEWQKADAIFDKEWQFNKTIEQPWTFIYPYKVKGINYNLSLYARLTPFKHTGVFPEQAANWEWLTNILNHKSTNQLKILNLFGYTGAVTCLLAKLDCLVTHVDASKPSITWAKENAKLNKLGNDSIRWILDDAAKFVEREIKRGNTYDGVLMDPPAFGHGPTGKTWKFDRDLPELLQNCVKILSPQAKFLMINAYATNTSSIALQNLLEDTIKDFSNKTSNTNGNIESSELCLQQKSGRLLSTGITARWSQLTTNH